MFFRIMYSKFKVNYKKYTLSRILLKVLLESIEIFKVIFITHQSLSKNKKL